MIEKGRRGAREGRVFAAPARIELIKDAENPWYEVVLIEGRNRELRKLFEEVGHHVEKIRRIGFGPLVLDVAPGELRELADREVLTLQRAARGIGRKPAGVSVIKTSHKAAAPTRSRKPAQ